MKVCSKCHIEKDESEYPIRSGYAANACRECWRAYKRERYVVDRDHVLQYQSKYQKENRDKINARVRGWYSKKGDYTAKASKEWRENNPQKARATTAKWRSANPDKIKAKAVKMREELKGSYVKGLLVDTGWDKESITPDLIEIQRTILKIKRYAKAKEKTVN